MGFRPSSSEDDVMARQCRVEAKTFGKGAAKVTCVNPTAGRQRVRVPRGYLFHPENPGMQTLIAERETEFWIEPGQSAARDIDAFCGFSKNAVPHGSMRPSGLAAPSDVLAGQRQVWDWTRPWEP